MITEELPAAVSVDVAYQNARKNSDRQNAQIEAESGTVRAANARVGDETDFFKAFVDDPAFRRFVLDSVFRSTFDPKP